METAQRAVLFVDVTDSTKIYESLGDTVALALINGLFAGLDKIISKHSGAVLKTLGDGMVCVFENPDNAFRAACEMQSSVHSAAQGSRNLGQLKESMFEPEFQVPAGGSGLAMEERQLASLQGLFKDFAKAAEDLSKDYHEEYVFKRYLQDKWHQLFGR